MRPRIWVIIASVILALAFGFTGRTTDTGALDSLSGLAWLVAIVVALSLLPIWSRIIPTVEPMAGLFRRPVEGERWCTQCGSPTPQQQDCTVCGAEPKIPKEKVPKQPRQSEKTGKKSAKRDA